MFRNIVTSTFRAASTAAGRRGMTQATAAGSGGGGGAQQQMMQPAAATGRLGLLAAAGGFALGVTAAAPTESLCFFWGSSDKTDWPAVKKDIAEIIEDNAAGPFLVRLAWHCAGTYDAASATGGSNGATMRFAPESTDGANAGLGIARDLLEPIKAKYPEASYADIYTFAGKVAIEVMGGPDIKWKEGRTDAAGPESCPPNGRLPDAALGAQHLRDVFYRMGFNDQEIVALSGAHTLGFCHTDRSGFEGPWTEEPNVFDNDYYKLLLDVRWTVRPNFEPLQFENPNGTLMMLPTDMALVSDPKFNPHVKKYAGDSDAFMADFASAFSTLLELGVPR